MVCRSSGRVGVQTSAKQFNIYIYAIPYTVQVPIDPAGALFMRESTILFLGKMNIGGMYDPEVLIAQTTVTVFPLSPMVIRPSSLTPLVAITFIGLCTLVIPVSLMFHTLVDE